MCVICVLYEQDKLTKEEAIQAGLERINTEKLPDDEWEHVTEVVGRMMNLIDDEEYYSNTEDYVEW